MVVWSGSFPGQNVLDFGGLQGETGTVRSMLSNTTTAMAEAWSALSYEFDLVCNASADCVHSCVGEVMEDGGVLRGSRGLGLRSSTIAQPPLTRVVRLKLSKKPSYHREVKDTPARKVVGATNASLAERDGTRAVS